MKLDFPGFGTHSLRRANITWRQGVATASAIRGQQNRGPRHLPETGPKRRECTMRCCPDS